MSDTGMLLVEYEGAIATITLNRPAKLNAITPDMLAGLDAALTDIEASDDIRIVIVAGAGERAFSVGADINEWAALEPVDMWRRWVREGHRIFDRLAGLRQPTIAALNGFAFGGGLELALACDLRIAAEAVQLASPEVKIGTVPGWGGTQRLARLIGPPRAKQLVLTGGRVDAATASVWGLVNEVVLAAELMNRAKSIASEIAVNAPIPVQIAKQIIDGGLGIGAGATFEALAGALAATTADGKEGVASFREKRPPEFIGR